MKKVKKSTLADAELKLNKFKSGSLCANDLCTFPIEVFKNRSTNMVHIFV